jgi:putative membrane protein
VYCRKKHRLIFTHFINNDMSFTQKTPRRAFVKNSVTNTLALSTAVPLLASLLTSFTAEAALPLGDTPNASTEKEFRQGVIGPAELSLATSLIAVSKASQKNAKEFAGFELEEAKSVTAVLKDLGTSVPTMDAKAQATLNKIKTAAKGSAFDKAYIQAQLENHEFLRDLAQSYLKNSMGKTSPAESQTRHLATLALAVFKEHVAITKRILGELGS